MSVEEAINMAITEAWYGKYPEEDESTSALRDAIVKRVMERMES